MKHFSNLSQILTLKDAHVKDGRNLKPEDLSIIEDASVVFDKNKSSGLVQQDLPSSFVDADVGDLRGHCLTPELVDSHTHLIFGGDRAREYSMRLNSADYVEIANAGGILNTMKGTNALTKSELHSISRDRIERLHSYGIGSIEIKTGYGLNFEKEYELSHIVDDLKNEFRGKVQIINTLYAPCCAKRVREFKTVHERSCHSFTEKLSENIIDCVDIFHKEGYFDFTDTKAFLRSEKLNLPLKYADEFNDNKGAKLAAEMGALSTDHLLCTTQDGINALANSQTVATLLPGTGYFLENLGRCLSIP